MDRLPRETFLIVTSYVDFETRFQLACACKLWYNIISSHNLYETVYMDRDLQPAMDFFKKNPPFRSTVKSLQVNATGLNFRLLKQWPSLFPNVVNFSLASAEIDMFGSDYEDEQDEEDYTEEEESFELGICFDIQDEIFKTWERLGSLSEFTKFVYTGTMLHSGSYPDLTLLDINFSIVPDHMVDTVMDHLLMGLQHAPNLQCFKVIAAKLTLMKLNVLHAHAPHLQALILEDMTLGEDTMEISGPPSSQPAPTVTRLEMQGNRFSFYENDDLCITDWLDYVATKYPAMEVLKMNQFTPASETYDSCIIHLVEHCPRLKTLNVDVCHLSTDVLRALDDTQIRLEKYSSQSQDMTQLRNLSLSTKQRHSVYRLDLVVPIGVTDFVECLSRFTGLTTINTYPSSDIDYMVGKPLHVPINTFLKQHPRLEFLTLSSCVLYMDPTEEENEIRSVLDTLELEKVTLKDTSVLQFIPKACPSLQVMVLKARFLDEQPDKTVLNFSDHDLVYMDIYIQNHAYVCVVKGGVGQWYKYEKQDRKIKYVVTTDEVKKGHVLEIQMHSIGRISLGVPRDPFLIV
ncbi:hypothetical protein INT47_005603 [Mucor saturninus]|uniref:F-box domain-containing protein n=1 Tax=Mucor saturninus TaxID=64648 RepID=A0A8H7QLL1_9FUNG|nr:hypothetical protein INT47_005603 [Mucor saturninus]